jgi:hypothetical protein
MAMDTPLGDALRGFAETFSGFRAGLEACPEIRDLALADTASWEKLLTYKLLPHLEGEGCLVAAVAGGTNTGKSTVFNLLLSDDVSPVRTTAAATCRPVVAANAHRRKQCLSSRLMPEFQALPLERPEALVDNATPEDALFVAEAHDLPDRLILLDIPDVDSIDQRNWEVAENIQAAGDVLLAILTGEKYKDERVIAFFRRALAAGRVILPLMNKANPAADYQVARAQIADFAQEVGLESPASFALPHDFDMHKHLERSVAGLDGQGTLRDYLERLDVPAIKARVYKDTVSHFASQAESFLAGAWDVRGGLEAVVVEFEKSAADCAALYDPQPDEKVGVLLHDYIRARRGVMSRSIGALGGVLAKGLQPWGLLAKQIFGSRAALERAEEAPSLEERLRRQHEELETHTLHLLQDLMHKVRTLAPPAAELIGDRLDALDTEAAIKAVCAQTLSRVDLSDGFREHVGRTLEDWWKDNRLRRFALQELDALILLSPAAIAAPLAFYTGGVGVPEVAAAASPLAGAFFSRVMEHQLADRWFDMIAPWRLEQQERFRDALAEHILSPCLGGLHEALDCLDPEALETMGRWRRQCLKAS